MKEIKGGKARTSLSCDICGTFFDNDKDYMNHLETAHKIREVSDGYQRGGRNSK